MRIAGGGPPPPGRSAGGAPAWLLPGVHSRQIAGAWLSEREGRAGVPLGPKIGVTPQCGHQAASGPLGVIGHRQRHQRACCVFQLCSARVCAGVSALVAGVLDRPLDSGLVCLYSTSGCLPVVVAAEETLEDQTLNVSPSNRRRVDRPCALCAACWLQARQRMDCHCFGQLCCLAAWS